MSKESPNKHRNIALKQPNTGSNVSDYNSDALSSSFDSLSPRSIEQLNEIVNKTPVGLPPQARYSFDDIIHSNANIPKTTIDSCDMHLQLVISEGGESQPEDYNEFSGMHVLMNPCAWVTNIMTSFVY